MERNAAYELVSNQCFLTFFFTGPTKLSAKIARLTTMWASAMFL